MDEITEQQTAAKLAVLPQEIRDLLASPATLETINAIGKRHFLNKVECGLLAQVTSALVTGTLKPADFLATLMDYLSIPREKAALMAKDLNGDIFNHFKESLKVIHAGPGGIQKLDPSLVTCLPAQMSKEAALGNKAPGNAPMGNILEQKLAGTFRMKGDGVVTDAVPTPRLVVPPPPQSQMPPIPPPPPAPQAEKSKFVPPSQHPTEPPRIDPYRDHDI